MLVVDEGSNRLLRPFELYIIPFTVVPLQSAFWAFLDLAGPALAYGTN